MYPPVSSSTRAFMTASPSAQKAVTDVALKIIEPEGSVINSALFSAQRLTKKTVLIRRNCTEQFS